MKSDARLHPTVRMALEALESGDRDAWEALFESEAELFDDGKSRSLGTFSRDALGHERFTSIEDVENDGRDVVGQFHSDRWGSGKIKRLDIGQATR